MTDQLAGFRVAILATDFFEESELIEPRKALDEGDALDVEALIASAVDDPEFARALAELSSRIAEKLPRELREELPRTADQLAGLAQEARDRLYGEIATKATGDGAGGA